MLLKKKKYFITILIIFGCLSIIPSTTLFAQDLSYTKDFASYKKNLKSEFNIKVNKPEGFLLLDDYFIMIKIRKDKDKHSGNLYGPVFLSENKSCLLMYSTLSKHHSKVNPGWRLGAGKEIYPQSQIKADLGTALGSYYHPHHRLNRKLSKADFDKYVTIISGREAKKMFNADSVYIYDIPGADSLYILNNKKLEDMRQNKFPHCTRIFIYKKFRGILNVTFFFTNEAKENEEEYMRRLHKKIWYKRMQRFPNR